MAFPDIWVVSHEAGSARVLNDLFLSVRCYCCLGALCGGFLAAFTSLVVVGSHSSAIKKWPLLEFAAGHTYSSLVDFLMLTQEPLEI